MRIEVSCVIDAPVERVWSWWTDFGRAGEEMRVSHGQGSSRRRILTVEPGVITFEDRSFLGTIHRTVRVLEGHRLAETAKGSQSFESEWSFEPEGPGRTRVTRTMRLRAHALFGPFARFVTRNDLKHHCREAERELKA